MNYNSSKLTDSQKRELLKLKGFESEEGFCMGYEIPEDSCITDVFITKKEWIAKTFSECKEYFWNGSAERMMDFEEVWEYLEEDLWDEFKTESFEVFDIKCRDLLKTKTNTEGDKR